MLSYIFSSVAGQECVLVRRGKIRGRGQHAFGKQHRVCVDGVKRTGGSVAQRKHGRAVKRCRAAALYARRLRFALALHCIARAWGLRTAQEAAKAGVLCLRCPYKCTGAL